MTPSACARTVLLALACFVASCDHGPTEPSHAPASITLDQSAVAVDDSTSVQLTATVLDAAGLTAVLPVGSLAWTSSDSSVATVSGAGVVTAVHPGSAIITARVRPSLTATAQLTVRPVASRLERVTTDSLVGTVGLPHVSDAIVRVVDRQGLPVRGQAITFATTDVRAILDSAAVITDTAGLARTKWQLGTVAGLQTVTAAWGGRTVRIAARAKAGPVTRIVLVRDTIVAYGITAISTIPVYVSSTKQAVVVATDTWGNVTSAKVSWRVYVRSHEVQSIYQPKLSVDSTGVLAADRPEQVQPLTEATTRFYQYFELVAGAEGMSDSATVSIAERLTAKIDMQIVPDKPVDVATLMTPLTTALTQGTLTYTGGFTNELLLSIDGGVPLSTSVCGNFTTSPIAPDSSYVTCDQDYKPAHWHAAIPRGKHVVTLTARDKIDGQMFKSSFTVTVEAASTRAYSVIPLTSLPGAEGVATALNDSGVVVGYAGAGEKEQAVIWRAGVAVAETLVPDLPSPNRATAISRAGHVVGTYKGCVGSRESFLLFAAQRKLFEHCGLQALAVNARGTVLFGHDTLLLNGTLVKIGVPMLTSFTVPRPFLSQSEYLNEEDGVLYRDISWNHGGQVVYAAGSTGSGKIQYWWSGEPDIMSDGGTVLWYCRNSGHGNYNTCSLFQGPRLGIVPLSWIRVTNAVPNDNGYVARAGPSLIFYTVSSDKVTAAALDDPKWIVDDIIGFNNRDQVLASAHNVVTGIRSPVLLSPR